VKPGDRVELLRKLAARLAEADYAPEDVDLVLRQFGFSTSYEWEGSQRSYALAHLEDGADEALVALDEYLFSGSSREVLDSVDLPWEAGAFRLFISHTSGNAAIAGKVRDIFSRWRIDAFVAHTTIEPTREWERVIETALASCMALTALITDDFVASRWCDQEVGYCLARTVPVVPVNLGADPHGFIAKYQAVSVQSPPTPSSLADAIFRALARHSALKELMAPPTVYRYAGSRSFDGARANFKLIREMSPDVWTRELVEIAERAASHNDQLEHAVVLEPESIALPDAAALLLAPIRERLGMNATASTTEDDIPF
jgi:hypothetical protein